MRGRARKIAAPYEARLWTDIPWHVRLVIAYLRPWLALLAFRTWFKQVTVLPGDEFYSFARDVRLTVREVKPPRVVCEVATGCHLFWLDGRARAVPCVETIPRRPLDWWVP